MSNIVIVAQGSYLKCRQGFEFINPETNRRNRYKTGDMFWVTNSFIDQKETGRVQIQRKGKGHISTGIYFAPAMISEFFEEIQN